MGETDAMDRKSTGVEVLRPSGFHGYSAGLLVLREVPGGELVSTIVEFQVGPRNRRRDCSGEGGQDLSRPGR